MNSTRSPPSNGFPFGRKLLCSTLPNSFPTDTKNPTIAKQQQEFQMPLNDSIAVAPIDANITAPPSAQYDTMPMTKSFMDNSEFIFSSKDPDAACYKYFAPPKYQMFEWVSWANEYKQNHILTGRIIGITWERTDFHSTTNHERKWLYTLESFDSKGEILDYHFLDECNVYLPVQQK